MFGSIGTYEIFIILLIVLLLFGSKEMPKIARKVGKSINDLKRATQDIQDEFKNILDEDDDEHNDRDDLLG